MDVLYFLTKLLTSLFLYFVVDVSKIYRKFVLTSEKIDSQCLQESASLWL